MPLNVLIVGAGVCGPAIAMLLQRANPQHSITVVERSSTLRSTGQQIDLKTQAPHILRKMGLLDEIKSRCVDETGLEMVDSAGRRTAYFGASPSGERRLGLTSEYEIMRGDMVQILYDASIKQNAVIKGVGHGIDYRFGQTITSLDQSDEGADVTFSNGRQKRYDLVIAADGQGSRTRQLAFGSEISDASFKPLGIHAAYFSMPRVDGEGTLARGHLAPGRRMIITRTSNRPVTGTLLFTMKQSAELKRSYKASLESQKEAFSQAFRDIDWQADRLINGLRMSDDFYAHELGQIKMNNLSIGRVVLLGDAGYCPSPFTGLGTNLCLVGAYILAGELTRQENNMTQALKGYEEKMRPFIDECQQLSNTTLGLFFPSSRFGVWSMQRLLWAASKLTALMPRSDKEPDHEKQLLEYPKLNLPC
ncbi:FAD/NAD(P)-binding domain-containing protein [Aspergillus unguis]